MATPNEVHEAVRGHYGAIARDSGNQAGCCGPSGDASNCCAPNLYNQSLLENLPIDVTGLSLGCGDPVTIANLKRGETVLDLGSGGGIDCFMAAQAVGPEGRVIGVDMTPEMIGRARANAAKVRFDASPIEFRLGQIEALPVDDATVDVIMSNCVINLSPDKPAVFREAFRVLKPDGRVSISDIVTVGEFGSDARQNMASWSACVSGAIEVQEYVRLMRAAGFVDVQVVDKVNAGSLAGVHVGLPRIFSARITARKPGVGDEPSAADAADRPDDTSSGSLVYFDQVADQWDSMRQSFFSDEVREAALRRAGVQAGKTAADIGAGTGFITEGLLREGLRVIAIDQSDNMLVQMREKFGAEAAQYRRGEAESLPLDDGEVDYAFANMYLHHVENPGNAIREMARAVKPGGMLVITDLDEHSFEFLRAEHHDRWMGFKREDVLGWLQQAGLKHARVGSVGSSCCADSSCGCGSASVSIFIASGVKQA